MNPRKYVWVIPVSALFTFAWILQRSAKKDDVPQAALVDAGFGGAPVVEDEDAGPARAAFGAEMARAAEAATAGLKAHFVEERFALEWEKGEIIGTYFLERSHREYLKLPPADRAAYVAKRAAMITGPVLPATLAEAEPKLIAVVRERITHEVARILASPKPLTALRAEPPHVALTDDLWAVLAYETEEQFVRIEADTLAKWGVSFEKAWPGALARLEQRSAASTTRTTKGLHELRFGDSNESARLLVPSVLAKLKLPGDAAVATPKDDLLLVASVNDPAALEALAERLSAEWDAGSQNVRVVRVAAGKTTPLVLDASHPLRARFEDFRRSAEQRDERLQREALRKRLGEREDAPFVASLIRTKNPTTNDEFSFVVHTEETPSLVPRADFVVFRRVDLVKRTATTLACGSWDTVVALMKGRWKETPLKPARWHATEHPTAKELKELGCAQPMLALDMGVARSVQ